MGKKKKTKTKNRSDGGLAPELQQQIDDCTASEDVDGLVRLVQEKDGKVLRKAVKRALFRLSQRGVQVPELPSTDGPAVGRSLGPATLPVLMGVPEANDGRLFTFAIPEGREVRVIEAYFQMPEGLDRLQGSTSTRAEYLPWARQLCAWPGKNRGTPPQRVVVPSAMLGRKLWEIGRCVRDNRLGPDVDEELARRIAGHDSGRRHPIFDEKFPRDLPELAMSKMAEHRYRLRAFYHDAPQAELRAQSTERGGAAVRTIGSNPLHEAAREWAEEWEAERVSESMLDVAAFCAGLSDFDAAHTLRSAVDRDEMVSFLQQYVSHLHG